MEKNVRIKDVNSDQISSRVKSATGEDSDTSRNPRKPGDVKTPQTPTGRDYKMLYADMKCRSLDLERKHREELQTIKLSR